MLQAAIGIWKPANVIMTGIAAVIPGGGRKIGDMLIADTVLDMSEIKQWPNREELRARTYYSDATLSHAVKDFLLRETRPHCRTGLIISQTDLVKSAEHRDELAALARAATGIE